MHIDLFKPKKEQVELERYHRRCLHCILRNIDTLGRTFSRVRHQETYFSSLAVCCALESLRSYYITRKLNYYTFICQYMLVMLASPVFLCAYVCAGD